MGIHEAWADLRFLIALVQVLMMSSTYGPGATAMATRRTFSKVNLGVWCALMAWLEVH